MFKIEKLLYKQPEYKIIEMPICKPAIFYMHISHTLKHFIVNGQLHCVIHSFLIVWFSIWLLMKCFYLFVSI